MVTAEITAIDPDAGSFYQVGSIVSTFKHFNWQKRIILILLAVISITACSPLVKNGQPVREGFLLLENGSSLGQTLFSPYAGLQGIVLYLEPANAGSGILKLHLRTDPQAASDLTTGSINLQSISTAKYYRIPFPSLSGSRKQDYYMFIEIDGGGSLEIAKASGSAYLNGAFYQDGLPQDAQLNFRLLYDPLRLYLGLAGEMLAWLALLFVAGVAFLLPGWGLLSCFLPGWEKLSWGERLGLSAGFSLAVYPLLILWTSTLGLSLGVLIAWLPVIAGILLLLWKNRATVRHPLSTWTRSVHSDSTTTHPDRLSAILLPDLVYILVLPVLVFTRFWPIRDLDLPMWGDSIQHTMIAQLLVDHGGLFDSWAPYAELQSFTYHFGFHAATAVYSWLTHLSLPLATLYTGQILNILAVLSLYPLAIRITHNRWAGVIAVVVAGLLSPFPQAYTNWGRYTQLAGQVILPLVICLALQTIQSERFSWRLALLSAAALAGLALSHYRVLVFAIPGLLAVWVIYFKRSHFRVVFKSYLVLGIVSGVLFLPWLIHISSGKLYNILSRQISTPLSQAATSTQLANTFGNLQNFLPAWLWILAALCFVYSLLRRQKAGLFIILWWGLIILSANPQWLGLPGPRITDNFSILIAAYLPVSLLISGIQNGIKPARNLPENSSNSKNIWVSIAFLILIVATGIWGSRPRLADIDIPDHALASKPDLRAMVWIKKNTLQDARFLVNSLIAFDGTIIAGSDGGWWLPILANRLTTQPPINYAFETGPRPNYQLWSNTLIKDIDMQGLTSPGVLAELADRGVTYVYIGQQQGRVNNDGPTLDPQLMINHPNFSLLYHQDRVWIFEFSPPK